VSVSCAPRTPARTHVRGTRCARSRSSRRWPRRLRIAARGVRPRATRVFPRAPGHRKSGLASSRPPPRFSPRRRTLLRPEDATESPRAPATDPATDVRRKRRPATTVRFPEGAFETAPTRVAESDADGDNPPADRRWGSFFFSRKTFFARLAETRLSTDASRFPLPHLAYVNTAERSRCIARHAFGRESVRASASPNTSYYETEDGPGVDERLRLLREEEEKNSSGGSRARFAPRFETEKEPRFFRGDRAERVAR